MEGVLQHMHTIRQDLKGDFAEKVRQLDDLTKLLIAKQEKLEIVRKPAGKNWTKIVLFCLLAFLFMLLGHALLSYLPLRDMADGIKRIPEYINVPSFLIMLLTGFLAQMVDGSMGMGYGTISTTFLFANGVNPAIVSSRVHSARVFSSGVSGFSHHRFGNINKKLFQSPGHSRGDRSPGRSHTCLLRTEIFRLCANTPFYLYFISGVFYCQEKHSEKEINHLKSKGPDGWLQPEALWMHLPVAAGVHWLQVL